MPYPSGTAMKTGCLQWTAPMSAPFPCSAGTLGGGIGIGIGIGFGIAETRWISTTIPLPSPTPKPLLGFGISDGWVVGVARFGMGT